MASVPQRRLARALLAAGAILIAVAPHGAAAGKDTHTYADNEEVVVWTSKVGPYNNPQETYNYHTLGLCELEGKDIELEQGDSSIGEALQGHEFISSPRVKLPFGRHVNAKPVCRMKLTLEKAKSLAAMVHENYWYQIYVDDLPIWAFLGEHSKFNFDVGRIQQLLPNRSLSLNLNIEKAPPVPLSLKGKALPKVYTHRHFNFFKNGNQIIEVDMEPSNPWPIYPGAPLNFTYSAEWHDTAKEFGDRQSRYLDPKFFEHKVHWFSIVNSFMLCLFLVAVVAIILMKTLKRDFLRYSMGDLEELDAMDTGDESGWKQVNGDVFRRPDHLQIFTVFYASGCHLACSVFVVLIFSMLNSYYKERGATGTSFVVAYLVTVFVGGYEGGRTYRMYGGQHWKKAMAYQCAFMPAVGLATFSMINTTALMYGSTMVVPFKTAFLVAVLFIFLCVPLHTVGTLLGRRQAAGQTFPCRVHHLKRPIPMKHGLFSPAIILTAGLVPFGCLFIEMYFIMSAVWSHNKIYYVYGFMFAILILLSLVIVCVSITCTYVLLNAEDYRWQWQSFLCCSSTAFYVFLYTIYYFNNSTQMSGFFQTLYYYGTSINFCIGLALFCGSLGFAGASKFVHLIYSNIKAE
eukprot:TRINITY_DN5278_c0_g1_i1.p1 TRINITY_DN5278_c0_g1~~TRINITY_DN5278_c0_g1_i1.p1  ORF type:complete len:685 (+),score=145.30 TRINITY_DN5278_c0_g1_i1:169-2055(+)